MNSSIRRTVVLRVLLCAGMVALVWTGAVHGAEPDAAHAGASRRALGTLVKLAGERMMTADTVAAAKWGTSQPIDDAAREQVVLEDALARGAELGIPPATVSRIFEDQIAANKTVQRALYSAWQAAPEKRPTHRPDLSTQVRPVLDRIDGRLLTAIRDAQPLLTRPGCGAALDRAKAAAAAEMGLDAVHREGLDRALVRICAAPSS
ncbi:chorismate mutase [Streptomyces sp. NPDC006487]|uniref:chorismate mutase n=1 Tax=Streptomyces sp. NPDC006487 TaxID=3364748 RepID=UPI0036D0CA88